MTRINWKAQLLHCQGLTFIEGWLLALFSKEGISNLNSKWKQHHWKVMLSPAKQSYNRCSKENVDMFRKIKNQESILPAQVRAE